MVPDEGNMSSIALLSSKIQECGHPILCDPNPDGIYEEHNFETVATKLRSGKGPLWNLMIVWANEHQYLSNFQVTVLSKGIFLVFDQDSEDFKQVEKTIAKKK